MEIPVILKGATSNEVTLTVADGWDYGDCTLRLVFCGATRDFTDLRAGDRLTALFTAEETALMPLGTWPAQMSLRNPAGETRLLPWAKIKVTDSPEELSRNAAIAIDPAALSVAPATAADSVGDLKNKFNAVLAFLKGTTAAFALFAALHASAALAPDTLHDDIPGNATIAEIVEASITAATNAIPQPDLSGYALKSEIPAALPLVITNTTTVQYGNEEYSRDAFTIYAPYGPAEFSVDFPNGIGVDKISDRNGHVDIELNQDTHAVNITHDLLVKGTNITDRVTALETVSNRNIFASVRIGDGGIGDAMLRKDSAGTLTVDSVNVYPSLSLSTHGIAAVHKKGTLPQLHSGGADTNAPVTFAALNGSLICPFEKGETSERTYYYGMPLANLVSMVVDLSAYDFGSFATTNDVAAAKNEVNGQIERVYNFVSGDGVWFSVTNYNRQTAAVPTMALYEIRDGVTNCVWSQTEGLARTLASANSHTDSEITALRGDMPDKAWGLYTSGLGLPAPSNTTWISTPETVIAGGLEYQKTVGASGSYWILVSNGMTAQIASTNGFMQIKDDNGETGFTIRKSDSYTVGAAIDGITVTTVNGYDHVRLTFPVYSATTPIIMSTPTLSPTEWTTNSPATVVWSGQSGAWIADIDMTERCNQRFFKAEVRVEGESIIEMAKPLSAASGILCTDGVHKCRPVWNSNNTITWEVVQ